jgi:hypothetical protein
MIDLKKKIEDLIGDDETVLLADGFEDAFVGIGRQFGRPIAIYDRAKCIQVLMRDEMDHEVAEEYFQFNVEGAWVGDQTPIFLEVNE